MRAVGSQKAPVLVVQKYGGTSVGDLRRIRAVAERVLARQRSGDRVVVVVDDVSYTGRTARAAMDELADFGRPRRIVLCVLVDRGERELPIQPDIVGRHITVPEGMRVEVLVPELDGRLGVELGPMGA